MDRYSRSRYLLHRHVIEPSLELAYRRGWPARLWERFAASGRVTSPRHVLPVLREGASRVRIAFLSDLHVGPTTARRTLDRAFALAAEARPDVLILGGDYLFLSVNERKLRALAGRVEAVPAALKLGVLGNHDHWSDAPAIAAALERAGVRMLDNDAVLHDGVAFVGIDDPGCGRPNPEAAFAACPPAAVRVGVSHSPEGAPAFEGRDCALLLCGHTHGGHISTPWGAPYVPGRIGRRHPHGMHELGDLRLFVSRGVGGVGLPMRSWAPPDVAVFDLVPG